MNKLSLRDLMTLIKKYLLLLLAAMLCGGLFGFVFTRFLVSPQYTASALLYVTADENGNATSDDFAYAEDLTATYLELVESKTILEKAVASLREHQPDLTAKALAEMLDAASHGDTSVFTISMTSDVPETAVTICNQVSEIAVIELPRLAKAGCVEIIDPAKEEHLTVEHPVLIHTLLGAVLSVLLVLFVILLRTLTDHTIRTETDISALLKRPVLSVIPKRTDKTTSFHVTEAYRMARTGILHRVQGEGCHVLAFVGARPAEGTTTTACELARLLAENGSRVLLIDADMRRPRADKYLSIHAEFGLSDYLTELCKDIPICKSSHPKISVLTAGKSIGNASELLASPRFFAMLNTMRSDFDYILLDLPPIGLVTDATVIAPLTDGYVFVACAGHSEAEDILSAVETLAQTDCNILGILLTDADIKKKAPYGT